MSSYADAVRRERAKRGMSAREAARLGGVSNTLWSNFENGQRHLTPAIIAAVAAAFGWSENWPDDVAAPTASPDLAASVDALAAEIRRLREGEEARRAKADLALAELMAERAESAEMIRQVGDLLRSDEDRGRQVADLTAAVRESTAAVTSMTKAVDYIHAYVVERRAVLGQGPEQ